MEFIKNYKPAVKNIRNDLRKYLKEKSIKSLIIGISGGIDSALVAALVKPVCDEFDIPLIGRSITIESNEDSERKRANEIGKNFCTDYEEINLTDEFRFSLAKLDDYKTSKDKANTNDLKKKIRMGNIKARMRMMYLYNLASLHSGMVLSTDNLTEYYLGFWTLHGDVGDYGPIQSLWKTEVYEMSNYLVNTLTEEEGNDALYDCILANATDGLGITNTDLDQILPDWETRHNTTKSGYNEVDELINMYISTGKYPKNKLKTVSDRIKNTEFKRNNPYNTPREIILKN